MSKDYKQGFNAGFMLTEHLPDLAHGISKTDSALPWMEGFREGRMEYLIQEQIKEVGNQRVVVSLPWLHRDMNRDHQPDQTKEQDKDDRDIER